MEKKIRRLAEKAIEEKVFPGAEIFFSQGKHVLYHECFGTYDICRASPALQKHSIFDLASLTKPLATSAAIMHLVDRRKLALHASLTKVIPEFFAHEKEGITLTHLLTHTSGLPAWRDLYSPRFDKQRGWEKLCETGLIASPGNRAIYSCLGFLVLSEIVRRVSGVSLSEYCHRYLFCPMRITKLSFRPGENCESIVPTVYCPLRKRYLQGVVHDENAYLFDEEGGNAGLFGSALDIYKFCRMIFNEGTFGDKIILSQEAVQDWTKNHMPGHLPPHALGWCINSRQEKYRSCGQKMPMGSLGHLGFTGTSLWIDKRRELVVIVLSNRVNVSREANVALMRDFRPRIHDLLLSLL